MATRTTAVTPAILVPGQRTYHGLKVNGSRMLETLHKTCDFGKAYPWGELATETGMARLSLNDDDKKVRDWLLAEAETLGCTVTVDQMGNMFVVRPGRSKDAAPVMMGSHLDTQPTGGRYDGILGVMAGLEVLRTLEDNKWETEGPVGLVNWTNEEGARFPIVTVASAVWAGAIPLETAWALAEVSPPAGPPQTMKQELARIGYLGATPASHASFPIAAHFELHIEQGPVLEDAGRTIGVVTGAQAHSWFEVVVSGSDSHAGTTPLGARQDAVLAAARMIVASNEVAKQHQGLITTGIVGGVPGSVNTVPHTARFTLDVRHASDVTVVEMVGQCRARFEEIARGESERGVEVSWRTLTENKAVMFHEHCIRAVEEAAEEYCSQQLPDHRKAAESRRWQHITSGAGHDSCQVSKICPAAMIFTPTRKGRSHTPDEYCPPEDCVAGAQVLLGAVLRYDASRKL
ncbi:Amidase, hydantoinase/carbamoylase [Cordyceps fumosorosea ARSEF 2679]|uniref:Amidase, hydantoinase/carbamoylase n=1 Tax=Cordyceps fumosorosea (strain ARSEF 2679) TaxID=1081104 RepID=A0A167SYY6_CORFA|nr:Amidase, hydantoinase/carbamoylase [Cordyceps fumosorosea ARSEF 2679]OAA60074.1 Amidase, hydantoinase/carbamoylase [Cordyceps fumosorosea ARSEF 2679]